MEQISKFLRINVKDLLKGMIVAFITTAIQTVYDLISSGGQFPKGEEWKGIALVSITAMLGYIIKNWLTNSEGQFLKKEQS